MKPLNAVRLSALLFGVLGLLIVILIAGSAIAASKIVKQSTAATHAVIDATVSADDPQRLEALKDYLAANATGISQTAALTAGIGQYDQTRIVATVSGYAKTANVTVTGFDFSGIASGASAATAAGGAAASNGTFSVTLSSPIPYQNFIVFLRLLEHGLMPASVMSGTVTADGDTPGNVVVSPLIMKVAG